MQPATTMIVRQNSEDNLRKRNIYITRHGQRIDFLDKAWPMKNPDCQFDPSLSELGVEQAAELGEFCKGKNITRIISSPYIRCIQTAFEVAKVIQRERQQKKDSGDGNGGSGSGIGGSGGEPSAVDAEEEEEAVKICVEPGCQEFYDSSKVWTEERMPQWYFYHERKESRPKYEEQYMTEILPFIDLSYVPLYTEDEYFLKRHTPSECKFLELRSDLEVRLTNLFEHIMHDPDPRNQNVLFVTHAAGLISSVETLMQRRHSDMRTGVCGLTTVLFDPDTKTYELVTNNDCSFLKLGEMHHWMYKSS